LKQDLPVREKVTILLFGVSANIKEQQWVKTLFDGNDSYLIDLGYVIGM